MAATPRSVRSNAVPAGRRHNDADTVSKRPQLRAVTGGRLDKESMLHGLGMIMEWTRTRSLRLLHLIVAVIFLLVCLLGSLLLRTQMVQNSFEAAEVEANITRLEQDIESEQTKLDKLEASLLSKAEDMGMVPQSGSLSIDLNGYQPSEGVTQ